MIETKSLLEMAKGAIMEQVNIETAKVLDNIIDPNTEAKKKRQIVLTVDFTPSADRQTVTVSATAKSKLLPNNAIQTSLYVGVDHSTGEVIATEMSANIPGQMGFDGSIEPEAPKLKMTAGGKA